MKHKIIYPIQPYFVMNSMEYYKNLNLFNNVRIMEAQKRRPYGANLWLFAHLQWS